MNSPSAGLAVIDWAIIALYALGTLALGYFYGRRQTSLNEYFTGSGRMNSTLVGFSIFATGLSTISYLSVPGEAIGKGPGAMFNNFMVYPILYLVMGYVFLPLYMRRRVISAYEYLEERLGLRIRLLGAAIFLFSRLIWMSLLVYLSARAMTVMLGVDESWIPVVILVTGFVAVIYTSVGGLRTVVITDTLQLTLMLGGAWLVIGIVTYQLGAVTWIPTSWQPHWDHQPWFSFDPAVRVTVFGSVIYVTLGSICGAASDQSHVQRYMATGSLKAARRSFIANIIAGLAVVLTLWTTGLALLGYVQQAAQTLPSSINVGQGADDVFPYFIAYVLPPGVSGLVVSAIFAAAMSSVDSGVNSITAVVSRDFLHRFGRLPDSRRARTRLAKIMAFSIGTIVVVGGSLIDDVPGNIWAVGQKTSGLLSTPLFALFFFAFFVPFATPLGVVCGTVAGITTAVLVAYSGPIFGFDPETGYDPVSFIWIGPFALAANLLVGSLASYVHQWLRRFRKG